ncbi:cytochrome c oxidase subunit 3 [Calycomorphotria hydatis]|uniref:Cytochrome c oxidase subunit 3 n=1 Tax=Calycomorphotria hydatis TaxID=2528027 RepID=A0A517T8Y3_9PLAN|nr:cytochrome c oxidase subunit 3 [Calycomorphotria hydatis]QDT64841.1 Cytochrome c oxidase subunit 3 [Calycomorphotria hydatis]
MASDRRYALKETSLTSGEWDARKRSLLAMWLFLASLAMFFVSSVVLYLVARYVLVDKAQPVHLPWQFWLSTAVLLLGGYSANRAVDLVRRERQEDFRAYFTTATCLGFIFCAIQTFGMMKLLDAHFAIEQAGRSPLNGILFVMIFLHAVHFIVGLSIQVYVNVRAFQGRYDHEYYQGVRLSAIYWRFLDIVWLVMLATFWFTS